MLDLQAQDGLTLRGAVRKLAGSFRQAGLQSPGLDARILVAEACGLTPEDVIREPGTPLSAKHARRIAEFAARRLAGEPVSRILGRREFWGLHFSITPATLDPRQETELLAETVLAHFKAKGLAGARLRILDIGTGSGCLLGALLSELPLSHGIGLDRSEAALAAARNNLSQLGLLDRSPLLCADWMSALGGAAFDAIVCNPPYIKASEISELELEVRGHDPRLALDGGADGLAAYRLILPQAIASLREGGIAVFETGHDQGKTVLDLTKQCAPHTGWIEARIVRDLGGVSRAVAGVRQS